jgi:hypothetical protein
MKGRLMNAALAMMFGMLLPPGLSVPAADARRRAVRQRSTTPVGVGPGWTQAHVKRMAKKRRNQRRNRLAHKRRSA